MVYNIASDLKRSNKNKRFVFNLLSDELATPFNDCTIHHAVEPCGIVSAI